jgi:hypothetical protein
MSRSYPFRISHVASIAKCRDDRAPLPSADREPPPPPRSAGLRTMECMVETLNANKEFLMQMACRIQRTWR